MRNFFINTPTAYMEITPKNGVTEKVGLCIEEGPAILAFIEELKQLETAIPIKQIKINSKGIVITCFCQVQVHRRTGQGRDG
jgi:hypothetical protein